MRNRIGTRQHAITRLQTHANPAGSDRIHTEHMLTFSSRTPDGEPRERRGGERRAVQERGDHVTGVYTRKGKGKGEGRRGTGEVKECQQSTAQQSYPGGRSRQTRLDTAVQRASQQAHNRAERAATRSRACQSVVAMRAWLLLCVLCAGRSLALVSEPSGADVARQKTLYLVRHLWRNVSDPHFTTMVRQEGQAASWALLGGSLQALAQPLHDLQPPRVSDSLQYVYAWERVRALSHGIHSLYETYANFLRQEHRAQPHRAWLDIAETILQDLPSTESLHAIVVNGTEDSSKRDLYRVALSERLNNACDDGQSTQLLLYNMYATVQVTLLERYIMAQSAWALLQIFGQGDHEMEAKEMTERYIQSSMQQANSVVNAMREASRVMWRCDPLEHKEHKTYEQLTRLLQGYIENEVDMNPTQTCRGGCYNYEFSKNYGCFGGKYCSQQPKCEGNIIDCQFIESDMKVCQSNLDSYRRYEYIEYKKNTLLGTERVAQAKDGDCTLVSVNSWWRFFLPAHCTYCFCLCDEPGPKSDRFFSLSPATADVTHNKVMTGLRFIKVNRVMYMQIQQGSLLPHGAINISSLEWVPINKSQAEYKMSWERRSIDLDDLEAPDDHIVTGVRFQEVGTHLNMEIMVTPINFHKGNLRRPTELSYWINNANTDSSFENPRSELKLHSNNVPQSSNGPCQPDSKHDTFMQFTHSDIITDAAQTSVPFLDIQDVVHNPPSLLSGVGLYHKGSDKSAGFVAPKIFNYDISRHIMGEDNSI